MLLSLLRLDSDPQQGTIGALLIDGVALCWTMEPYCYGNAPNVSAIPPQPYVLKPYTSQRYGQTWEVTGIFGREYVLIHAGNLPKDTQGCIMPGDRLGEINGTRAVLNSRNTLTRLLTLLRPNPTHRLIIKEVY